MGQPIDYDLILRHGHVVDPSQSINRVMDIGIHKGVIAELGQIQAGDRARIEKDLRGMFVCPGFVDLHGHWYEGSSFGIDPAVCLNHGVTTVVDAGTTGFINFPEFRTHRIDTSPILVLAFIHIACLGLPTTIVGELEDIRFARPKETARMIERHRDVIVGLKIRQGLMTGSHGPEGLEKALGAASDTGLPLMVHIGKGANTRDILRKLRPGDIVTHCFQGRGDGILTEPEGAPLPEMIDARQRGVLFDVGHGCGSFSWKTARKALEHGIYPDTISTDLHRFSIERWAIDMPTTISKFLHLGMPLVEVILRSTWAPAKAIGRDAQLGTLRKGTAARIVVFQIEEGEFEFEDTFLRVEKATKRIKPVLIVNNGRLIEPGDVPVSLRELDECDYDVLNSVEERAAQSGSSS